MPQPPRDDIEAQLATQQRRRDTARAGAYAQHAKHDPRETTRGAFQARMRRYREQVDPTGELARRDPQALAKRVEAALAADMAKVRLARSQKRERTLEAKATTQARQRAQNEAAQAAIIEQLRRTPPDDLQQLATHVLALQALSEQQP